MRSVAAFLLLFAVLVVAICASSQPVRAAWPYPDFKDNIEVTVTPAMPTQDQPVTILIRSLNSTVFIKGANAYISVTSPENVTQGPYPYPMFQGADALRCSYTISKYPNGTKVSFYIVAWDYDNDLITSTTYDYLVQGTPTLGWRHEAFEDNVEVTMAPPIPQPHDEVTVSIWSREPSVAIRGANLYMKYLYQAEPPKAGGFVMEYVNATHLAATIPGFPPGTTVVFWIVAWDKNVDTITSPFYSYNLSVDKYTRHENNPFPQVDTYVGYSLGLALLVPVALYFADARRKRRGVR